MVRKALPLVLIVDDDSSHRLMLSTLLEEWGYRTADAEDGKEAVSLVRSQFVDLILMDMLMPLMNGIEATRRIHQHNPAIPVIMVTAYSSIPSAAEELQSGVIAYLSKPLDFDALKSVMEGALSGRRS